MSWAFSSDDDDTLDSSNFLTLSVKYLRLGDKDADLQNNSNSNKENHLKITYQIVQLLRKH